MATFPDPRPATKKLNHTYVKLQLSPSLASTHEHYGKCVLPSSSTQLDVIVLPHNSRDLLCVVLIQMHSHLSCGTIGRLKIRGTNAYVVLPIYSIPDIEKSFINCTPSCVGIPMLACRTVRTRATTDVWMVAGWYIAVLVQLKSWASNIKINLVVLSLILNLIHTFQHGYQCNCAKSKVSQCSTFPFKSTNTSNSARNTLHLFCLLGEIRNVSVALCGFQKTCQ